MTLKSLALAAVFAVAPFASQAATIIYQASGDVFYDRSDDGTDTIAAFFDDGSDDIDVFAQGTLVLGVLEGDLIVSNFDVENPELLSSATLVSFEIGSVESGLRTFTALFGGLTGTEAGRFGEFAKAIFTFADGDEADGELQLVNVAVLGDLEDVAPVPLPASLPLLLAGMGAIVAARRKRA